MNNGIGQVHKFGKKNSKQPGMTNKRKQRIWVGMDDNNNNNNNLEK